ncbi:divalent metal cation (Fe/Co/Zn/Cd) transporter [Pantoea ananatis]|nr:divalent metal cation (Fe/Co/Zn/Cd) transporter [Pantoea ananatis]
MRIINLFNLIGSAVISLFGLWVVIESWRILQEPACYKEFCSVLLTDMRPLLYISIVFGIGFFVFGLNNVLTRLVKKRNV